MSTNILRIRVYIKTQESPMEFAVQIKQPQIEISDNTIMPALRNAQIETE